jgi:hypothetical protein
MSLMKLEVTHARLIIIGATLNTTKQLALVDCCEGAPRDF